MQRISTLIGLLLTLTAPTLAAESVSATAVPVAPAPAAAVVSATVPAALSAPRDGPGASRDGPSPSRDGPSARRDGPAASPDGPAAGRGGPAAGRDWRPPWSWPLSPQPVVVHSFDPPASAYGSGHRGIDLTSRPAATQVHAVAPGVVSHVGVIAGVGTVSVTHPGDIKSTYQPITATVRDGDHVGTGSLLGTLDVLGSHCAPTACLHLGALRRDSAGEWSYVDPLFLLGRVVIVLLPGGAGA